MLWFTALILAESKQARAADPEATFLDDGIITYKDLAHGEFELVTKEAIPRHILVDDPGQTIVLHERGSSVAVNKVNNTAAQMEELRAAQQDVLANLSRETGAKGSSTPPSATPLTPQRIDFIRPDVLLPQITPAIQAIFVGPAVVDPPVRSLTATALPIVTDTSAFDHFPPTAGALKAINFDTGASLSYSISGGVTGAAELGGVTYDVSKAGQYGTLYVNSSTGAYAFVPDNHAINALTATTIESFVVTVSDGASRVDQTFTVTINGVNDAAIIAGDVTGAVNAAGDAANAAAGTARATGTLTDTDVDNPPNTFKPVSAPQPSDGGYGVFTMTVDGVWTYVLTDTGGAVKALDLGDTLTDSFTVATIDGTRKVVTIIIRGANDEPIAHADVLPLLPPNAANVSQGGSLTIAASTLLANDIDPDTGDHLTVVSVSGLSASGAVVSLSGTDINYESTSAVALRALGAGQTVTDSFAYTIADTHGETSTATVTLVVAGVNDPPTILSGTDPPVQAVVVNPIALAEGVNTNSLGLATESFDDLPSGSDAFHGNFYSASLDATFSGSGNVRVINGSIPGVAVALFLGPSPGGADTTDYLSLSAGSTETITFGSERNTFGLYWGTIDPMNKVSFYNGVNLVVSYTGAEVAALLSAHQGVFASNGYLEFVGINPFDRVILETANFNAFELENISAGVVPDRHTGLAGPVSGTLTVSDVDIGDTLTASVIGNASVEFSGSNGSTTLPFGADVATLVDASYIAFDIVQTNGATQTLNWTYSPTDADLDFLKAGDELTIRYTAQVNDGHGNVGNQALTITILGTYPSQDMSQLSVVNGTSADETFQNVGNGVTIFGAGGSDNFVFNDNFGTATIGDFDVDNDTIAISRNVFSSVAEILAAATDAGPDTIITSSATHDAIVLKGVSPAQLHGLEFQLL
ncbi:VCBS domain-containing protein [Bradyrhizobium glycinis]|uniref:VCBS domain-containing protein n=1 Tax=Bradyrhizobium glycinis TaxID=2751812 RepID=UPI0018D7063E|nr:VCBS domain-containing protein [Bradyrhizobium glycinis]MBH5367880.1 cadherin-like domain-containing protein [Bradyrhizobium glycinis]